MDENVLRALFFCYHSREKVSAFNVDRNYRGIDKLL